MRKPIPNNLKAKIKKKFNGRCGYCGLETPKIYIDHIVPVLRRGSNEESNLMPSCHSCNNYKFSFDLEEFRKNLSEQIHKARKYSVNFRLAERYGLIAVNDKPIQFYFEIKP